MLLALLPCSGEFSLGQEPEPEEAPEAPRPLAEIEKEARGALAAEDFDKLKALAEEAVSRKEPEAYRSVIAWALRGVDADLEAKVFHLLKEVSDPAGRAVIYQETAKNPNYKTRIVLLGVVNQFRQEQEAFAVLARAVRDPSRPVALTAVRRMRESKDAARAAPVLIQALLHYEKTQKGRMVHDIKNALRALTGAELETGQDWKNYWESRGAPAPKPGGSLTRAQPAVKARFFDIPIESDRILFIIDLSGSMYKKDPPIPEKKAKKKADPDAGKGREAGPTVTRKKEAPEPRKKTKEEEEAERENLPASRERLFRVKAELSRVVQALPEHVNFTVLWFNDTATFIDEPARLIPATPENKRRVASEVMAFTAKGETRTDLAFRRGLSELKDIDTVYLLSDGAPYHGGIIPPDRVLDEVRVLNRFMKCRIHSIGFKQAGDNLLQFLKELAQDNDGVLITLK